MLLAATMTSHQLGRGHSCLDLSATLQAPDFVLSLPPEGEEGSQLPSQWLLGLDVLFENEGGKDRKSTRLNSQSQLTISYAVFCLQNQPCIFCIQPLPPTNP